MKVVIRDSEQFGCISVGIENKYTYFFVCMRYYSYPFTMENGKTHYPVGCLLSKENAMENAVEYKERLEKELENNFIIQDKK